MVILLHDSTDTHSIGQSGWQVFERMNDQVDFLQFECHFQFSGEESLLSDLRQGSVQNLVTNCRHRH